MEQFWVVCGFVALPSSGQCVNAGAAKGIGLACASCLGHEGAKVVVADLDEEGAKRYIIITTMRVCHTSSACLIIPFRESCGAWTVSAACVAIAFAFVPVVCKPAMVHCIPSLDCEFNFSHSTFIWRCIWYDAATDWLCKAC